MSIQVSFNFSRIGLAVVAALASSTTFAEEAAVKPNVVVDSNIERITVTGRSFNDYKVGSSSGAMRGDIDILDTPQSVSVIPDFVIDEQLATNLGEVLVNDSSVTGGVKNGTVKFLVFAVLSCLRALVI